MSSEAAIIVGGASDGLELLVQGRFITAEVVHIWHWVRLVPCLSQLSECSVVDLLTSIQIELSEIEWIGVLGDYLQSLVTDMLAVAEAKHPELI